MKLLLIGKVFIITVVVKLLDPSTFSKFQKDQLNLEEVKEL